MSKKVFSILCIAVLVVACGLSLIACDEQQQPVDDGKVTVKVITFQYGGLGLEYKDGEVQTIEQPNPFDIVYESATEIKIVKGTVFNNAVYQEYMMSIGKGGRYFGCMRTLGFYTDPACRKKYNEELIVNEDIVLYRDSRSVEPNEGGAKDFCIVTFKYKGEDYQIYRGFDERLTIDDFVISAYGKDIDKTTLSMYWDENYQEPYIVDEDKEIIAYLDNIDCCPGELTIYVKTTE